MNIKPLLFLTLALAACSASVAWSSNETHHPTTAWSDRFSKGSTYKVGAWTTDITPNAVEAATSCLGGYGGPFSRCGSSAVLDPITVRSLSIADVDTTVIFAVVDTVAVGDSVIAAIKDLVFQLTAGAIAKESIQIVATHTHAGPDLQGLWGGVSPAYKQRVINQVALSIVLANYTATDAKISATTLEDEANVRNRRGWDDVDRNIAVLDFKSTRSGERVATLVNMSAHPTILDASNMAYSAGFIHFVRKKIEKRLGGTALFINGRLGDASTVTAGTHSYADVRKYGRGVARKVIRNIKRAQKVTGDLSVDTFPFSHPITNVPAIGAVQAGLLDLEIDGQFNVNTQFSLLKIGKDISAVLFPGEILTRLAIPIDAQLQARDTFFFGLTDDSLGYFIPSDEYLMIEGRDTEERAAIDINAGDAILEAILEAIDE